MEKRWQVPGWTWQGWNEAANYCLRNDIEHKQALNWATRSVFMSPNPNNMMTKAQLTAKMKGEGDETKEKAIILSTLEKDLASFPVTWKEWDAVANYCMKEKQHEKALEMAKHSVNMSPNMTSMMTKAKVLTAMGKEADATKVKKKAIAKGSNAELNTYGYQLMFSGKTKEAVAVFEANAEKNPSDPNVWDSLGEGYMNNGQKEKAIAAIKKSMSLNPPANVKANSMKNLKQMGVEANQIKPKP